MMRISVCLMFMSCLGFIASPALAKPHQTVVRGEETVKHGGGCRKSSPPGKCCHMNRKTGQFHCH